MSEIVIPPQQTQTKSDEVPENSPLLKTLGIAEVVLITFFLFFFLGIVNYYGILPLSKRAPKLFSWLPHKKNSIEQIQTPTLPPRNLDAIQLPISLADPGVRELLLNYTVEGQIKEIKPADIGYEITLQGENSSLPPFVVNTNTQVLVRGATSQTLEVSNLGFGDTIRIVAVFNYSTKQWTVERIIVIKKFPVRNS